MMCIIRLFLLEGVAEEAVIVKIIRYHMSDKRVLVVDIDFVQIVSTL